ncbi:MAG: PIG-L deacetylase family protein [Pseudomonadota bacterium]
MPRLSAGLAGLRHALSRRFLLKIKRASHRANARLILPQARRVLVVAPHMDDEVIACGGTLLLLIAQGAEVHVAFVSDSSAGLADPALAADLISTRRAEAARVSGLMGFSGTSELGFPDSRLYQQEDAIAGRLSEEIRRVDPDLLLCPFPSDAHSDHMSCAASTARAALDLRWSGSVLAYEVWTPLWPNVAVDITAVAERKVEAINLYASQMADRDYATAALGLNRFRGLPHAVACAEAFYLSDVKDFARLAALLDVI